jgi:hypothetical protein
MNLSTSVSLFRRRQPAQLIIAAVFAACSLSAAQPAEKDFRSLFNGSNLAGWKGDPAFWSVLDGAITGQTTAERPAKGNTFLIWQGGDVKNFELRASFRMVANNDKNFANSGIQYRSKVVDPANWVVAGYQGDMDGAGKYIGMLYEEKGRGIVALPGQKVNISAGAEKPKIEITGVTTPPAEISAAIKPSDWNEYVIVAEGNHLRHFINGLLTADITDLDEAHAAESGVLALQLHAGPPMTVQFKNIRLKVLP